MGIYVERTCRVQVLECPPLIAETLLDQLECGDTTKTVDRETPSKL